MTGHWPADSNLPDSLRFKLLRDSITPNHPNDEWSNRAAFVSLADASDKHRLAQSYGNSRLPNAPGCPSVTYNQANLFSGDKLYYWLGGAGIIIVISIIILLYFVYK